MVNKTARGQKRGSERKGDGKKGSNVKREIIVGGSGRKLLKEGKSRIAHFFTDKYCKYSIKTKIYFTNIKFYSSYIQNGISVLFCKFCSIQCNVLV